MAAASGDFLSTFQADVTQHWNSTCAIHADILEEIQNEDLPELMKHDEEDPHGILALTPDPLKPCASTIRGYAEEAAACAAEFQAFVTTAEGDLGDLLKSCNEDTYSETQDYLDAEYNHEKKMVDATKMALLAIDGKSFSTALRLQRTPEEVDKMDEDEKAEQYEKMRSQLRFEHVQQTKRSITQLTAKSKLPILHEQVFAQQQEMQALQRKADVVTSKCSDAETLYAGLQQQQDELSKEIDKCERIRRTTVKLEEAKRKTLEEAEKARQLAWKEYQDAYLRNEAATIMEAKLKEAGHAIAEEVQAAGLAIEDARKQRAECVVEAANCIKTGTASIEACHAGLLAYSKGTVEEAWQNTAFAGGLCQCLVGAKRNEYKRLLKELRICQKQADNQKKQKLKAQALEKVEKLEMQISNVQAEVSELDSLSTLVKEQFDSFKALKSGLNEETIIRAAEDAASACYGSCQLDVSDDDSEGSTEASGPTVAEMGIQKHMPNPLDKLRVEMEEKFKIEKQQLMAEFQLEKQQLLLAVREEVKAELRREDASSLNSFEPVDDIHD